MNQQLVSLYQQGLIIPKFNALQVCDLSGNEKIVFSVIFSLCLKSPSGKVQCPIPALIKNCDCLLSHVSMIKTIKKLEDCQLICVERSKGLNRALIYSINEERILKAEIFNAKSMNELHGIEDYYNDAPIPEYINEVNCFTHESVTADRFNLVSIPARPLPVPTPQPPVQEEEKPKAKRFVKPTLQEITEVMAVKIREKYGSNVADTLINDQAESFLNYYESNGWKVGKNPMKNWHCAVANWIKNIKTYSTSGTGTSGALIVATAEQSSRPDFDTIYKEVIDIAGKLQNRSNWLSESANKNIMAGVRTFIAEEIKAHWNLYGESDWKNALNVFIFAQKSPLRYLDPNFCKNNGFDSGLYNEFWTGSTFFIPRSSDEPTVTEQVIESEHFQKSLQEDLERKRRVSEFKKKLNAHREEMANAYK